MGSEFLQGVYVHNKLHFTDCYEQHNDSFSPTWKKTYIPARTHPKYWAQYFRYTKQKAQNASKSHGLTNPRLDVFYTAYRAMPAFTILLGGNCHITCTARLRVPATATPNRNLLPMDTLTCYAQGTLGQFPASHCHSVNDRQRRNTNAVSRPVVA